VQLTKLCLFQFRNIEHLEFVPSSGVSLFLGRNGQGKTNLLEAIYMLGFGKSFRTATPRDCIQHGRSECRIEGTIKSGSLNRVLQIHITKTEKKLFLLGKPAPLDAFVGNLHLLAFVFEHLNIVRGGPAYRRAFLDRAMVTLYPGHMSCLASYGRVLKQRNSILSSTREAKSSIDSTMLDTWDEALVRHGVPIICNRMRYVERMKQELPSGLFGSEVLKMHYLPAVAAEGCDVREIETGFRHRLLQVRAYDQRTGSTSVGPHRDELKLYVNGKSLVDFGSAGQQRSSLLALYFSQMEIHRKFHGFYPVFLVDDAEAELDPGRLSEFLKYLSQKTQTFLTSARDFSLPETAKEAGRFEVQDGRIVSSN
jgi:DNA replication and repair protein RecF